MMILITHSTGVVALIMAMSDTTNTINSFVLGSSLMLYDSGLFEMLLYNSLADNSSDASENEAENNKDSDRLYIDRRKEIICIFSRKTAVDKILTVAFRCNKDREIV